MVEQKLFGAQFEIDTYIRIGMAAPGEESPRLAPFLFDLMGLRGDMCARSSHGHCWKNDTFKMHKCP